MCTCYISIRSPAPHDEVSKECKEEYLAHVKYVLTLYHFREVDKARTYYDQCGGLTYFNKQKFENLVRGSYKVSRKDDGEFDLVDDKTGNTWIMDSNELFQRINEALNSLKGRAKRPSQGFTVEQVRNEMTRQGWKCYAKSVERAFVAKKGSKVSSGTDVGEDLAPKSSRKAEHCDLTGTVECHDTSSRVASNGKHQSAVEQEPDECWIASFYQPLDAFENEDSTIASNDNPSYRNYSSMKEEFRACFLKREDPELLMNKFGVDVAFVRMVLGDLIKEHTESKKSQATARAHADEYHKSAKENQDENLPLMKQQTTDLRSALVVASEQHAIIEKALDITTERSRENAERRKHLDEESKKIDSSLTTLIADAQTVCKHLNQQIAGAHKDTGNYISETTSANNACFEAKKLDEKADKELEVLEQMKHILDSIENEKATDAAVTDQNNPASLWFGRNLSATGRGTALLEPVRLNSEQEAATECGQVPVTLPATPARPRAEKEERPSVRRSKRIAARVNRYGSH